MEDAIGKVGRALLLLIHYSASAAATPTAATAATPAFKLPTLTATKERGGKEREGEREGEREVERVRERGGRRIKGIRRKSILIDRAIGNRKGSRTSI